MSDEKNPEEKKEEATAETPTEPQAEATAPVATPVEAATPEMLAAKEAEEQKRLAEEEAAAKQKAEEEALAAQAIATPDLRPGMTVRVHLKVKEGEKERVQIFQGIITAMRGKTPETKTITVQKTSFGVMVERIFPLASPLLAKIEVVKVAKVRRAKLQYLKKYTKRLKETLIK